MVRRKFLETVCHPPLPDPVATPRPLGLGAPGRGRGRCACALEGLCLKGPSSHTICCRRGRGANASRAVEKVVVVGWPPSDASGGAEAAVAAATAGSGPDDTKMGSGAGLNWGRSVFALAPNAAEAPAPAGAEAYAGAGAEAYAGAEAGAGAAGGAAAVAGAAAMVSIAGEVRGEPPRGEARKLAAAAAAAAAACGPRAARAACVAALSEAALPREEERYTGCSWDDSAGLVP